MTFLYLLVRRVFGAAAIAVGAVALLAAAGAVETFGSSLAKPRPATIPSPPLAKICAGDTVARISVPRLEFEAPVREGVDEETLLQGPGHVPGTALPGEESGRNHAVIAVARDRGRAFATELVVGDRVELRTPFGLRTYRVVERRVVPVEELNLASPRRPSLTLLAAYPPDPIGPAPLRLAVRAELVKPSSTVASAVRQGGRTGLAYAANAFSTAFQDR